MTVRVNILAYDQCLASGLTIPMDLFNLVNAETSTHLDTQPFEARLVSFSGQPVKCSSNMRIAVDGSFDSVKSGDAVFFHQWPLEHRQADNSVKQIEIWLKEQRSNLSSIVSNRFHPTTQTRPSSAIQYESISPSGMDQLQNWQSTCHQFIERVCGSNLARLVNYRRTESDLPLEDRVLATLTRAEQWIQTNLARNITVEELAKQMAMSSRTLVRRFQTYLGQSPQKYIQQTRLERCKMLLQTTSLSFSQIVEACGYTDESALRKLFKKSVSLSPSEYRKKAFATFDLTESKR